jgi:hypothetical protein
MAPIEGGATRIRERLRALGIFITGPSPGHFRTLRFRLSDGLEMDVIRKVEEDA